MMIFTCPGCGCLVRIDGKVVTAPEVWPNPPATIFDLFSALREYVEQFQDTIVYWNAQHRDDCQFKAKHWARNGLDPARPGYQD